MDTVNNESIFSSIKKLLGVAQIDPSFDTDLLIHINTALAVVSQLGIGPDTGFSITGPDETWDSLLAECPMLYADVKSYVFLRVKMLFDTPTIGSVNEVFKESIREYEWRISVAADYIKNGGSSNE